MKPKTELEKEIELYMEIGKYSEDNDDFEMETYCSGKIKGLKTGAELKAKEIFEELEDFMFRTTKQPIPISYAELQQFKKKHLGGK